MIRRSGLIGWAAALVVLALIPVAPSSAFGAPANPRFVAATCPRANEVLINWEPLTTYSGTTTDVVYHIYRAPSSTGTFAEIGSVRGLYNISYLDTGTASAPLDYLRRYWYKIAAEDSSGLNATPQYMSGAPSGITAENLMSPTTKAPAEPRGLEASPCVYYDTVQSIHLTWSPVAGKNVARYAVYRQTASGTDGVLVGTTTATSTPSFDDTSADLQVETHYWYRVAAVAQYGSTYATGAASFEVYVRPMSARPTIAPHSGGSPTGDSCLKCHDMHNAPNGSHLLLVEVGADSEFCMSCHDGTGSRYDIAADFAVESQSRHPVDGGPYSGGDLVCGDCHTPHADTDVSFKLLRAYEATGTIEYCLVCHKPTTPDDSDYTTRTMDMTTYRQSAHNASGVADPPSGTGIKCRTCHLPHSSPNEDLLMYVGYRACLNCHSSSKGASLSSPDIYGLMTANPNLSSHHDILKRDQDQQYAGRMACQNCHNSHASTSTTPVIDPYSPAPWNPYPKTVPSEFAGTTNRWQNAFCFECHDNTLPGSSDTTPWVLAPQWNDPSHDGTLTSDLATITARWAGQRHGLSSTTGENVWPDVTATFGTSPELKCVDCHEPHGAINIHNLRSDVLGRTGLRVLDRAEVMGGTYTGYDSRFWCMGCHKDANSTHTSGGKSWATFPKDCSNGGSCHGHQNSGGQF